VPPPTDVDGGTGWILGCVSQLLHHTPHKKPGLNPDLPENYRPIFNLSFLSEVLERAVFTQIEHYLNACNLLANHQSAYRKFHSTLLGRFISDLTLAASQGHHTLLAKLDLSAAFDTVDHPILLERLSRSFNISHQALEWFTSYLQPRSQSVRFNNNTSPSTVTSCGFPQGSVLGPLLFILYTADIGSIALKHHAQTHSYADGTQLYRSENPTEVASIRSSIVACILEIAEWCAENKLKLNVDKTELMWSATARRQHQLEISDL